MKLSELIQGAPDIEISGLCSDSRLIKPQQMYFCMEGMNFDGHNFVNDVIEKGAVAIVHSKDFDDMKKGIAYIKVENVMKTLNQLASIFYGNPSHKLEVFAVTGTNGKSTVTSIIEDVYSHFKPCGYVGTIAIRYRDVVIPPTLTTPDPLTMQSALKDMCDADVKAVALEVSSHGLELGRTIGIDFDYAIFTNLTHDHLDFHGNFENYQKAKHKLFTQLKPSGVAIFNIDDSYAESMMKDCNAKTVTFSLCKTADYYASNITLHKKGTTFTLHHDDESYEVETNLIANYNISNLMAAVAAMCEAGIPLKDLVPLFKHIKQIEGRMECIDEGQPFNVFVDFAHTPDGLRKVFTYAQAITPSKASIITVFGSAGQRDTRKRPIFGEIADEYCDMIILTEDDPRDENPKEIAEEIKAGIKKTNCIYIEDREEAIIQAIEGANPEDTILILGKGDEVFMYREFGRTPWKGDHIIAKEACIKYMQENHY